MDSSGETDKSNKSNTDQCIANVPIYSSQGKKYIEQALQCLHAFGKAECSTAPSAVTLDSLYLAMNRRRKERRKLEGSTKSAQTHDDENVDEEEEDEVEEEEQEEKELNLQPRSASITLDGTTAMGAKRVVVSGGRPVPPLWRFSLEATTSKSAKRRVLDIPAALLSDAESRAENAVAVAEAYRDLASELNMGETKENSEGRKSFIVILLLKSGRFAGGVFCGETCVIHRACQRYTVRRGQGGAQSSNDGRKSIRSMGAQLRRAGEEKLRADVRETMEAWKASGYLDQARLVWISCPATMKSDHFYFSNDILRREDPRIRPVPLSIGRPTFEAVKDVHSILTTLYVREVSLEPAAVVESSPADGKSATINDKVSAIAKGTKESESKVEGPPLPTVHPFTALHLAAQAGDLTGLRGSLQNSDSQTFSEVNMVAGPTFETPLHLAAASSTPEVITELLVVFGADPSQLDLHGRPPYFLCATDACRTAFRRARAILGEDAWDWDGQAKVPPGLTDDNIMEGRRKAAEKKRKQRQRKKERLRKDREVLQAKVAEDEAKRTRAHLPSKKQSKEGDDELCDFCQKISLSKMKRSDIFHRLDFSYCSTECVRAHQRRLTAEAAMARITLNSNGTEVYAKQT